MTRGGGALLARYEGHMSWYYFKKLAYGMGIQAVNTTHELMINIIA